MKNGNKWETKVPYTSEELREHLEKQFKDGMTWDNYGDYWVLDHIKSICRYSFKSYKDKEFKECWALSNLQPLTKKEHNIKPI